MNILHVKLNHPGARSIQKLYRAATVPKVYRGLVTRSRGGPGHGTLRWTHTSEQAGKALRSQGHHYARVM